MFNEVVLAACTILPGKIRASDVEYRKNCDETLYFSALLLDIVIKEMETRLEQVCQSITG